MSDELDRIGAAEELEIAPRQHEGSPASSVIVWVVRHGNDVYVRSVNGRSSPWFQRALAQHEAVIRTAGVERDVDLIESDSAEMDDAYRTKYNPLYPSIVPSILSPDARAATLRLVSRREEKQ